MSNTSPNELEFLVKYKNDDASYNARLKDIENLDKQTGTTKSTGSDKETLKDLEKEEEVLKRLRKELAEYKESLAKAQEEVRKNGEATQDNIDKQRDLGTSIAETKLQIEQATRGSVDYNSILSQTPKTYNELVQQNRALSLAIKDLPFDEKGVELQKLTSQYNTNNIKLKELDATMGNHQRNGGNYTDSIRNAANAVAVFDGPLGPLAGRLNSVATVLNGLKKRTDAQTVSTITLAGAIKTALIATGIGALIVILGSLFQFYKRSEKGQERLRVITAKLGVAFAVVGDKVANFGETVLNAFEFIKSAIKDPRQAIEELRNDFVNIGKTIKANFIERIDASKQIFTAVFNGIMGTVGVFASKFKLAINDLPIIGGFVDTEKAEQDLKDSLVRIEDATADVFEGFKRLANTTFVASVARRIGDLWEEASGKASEAGVLQERMNELLRQERALMERRAEQDKDMAQAREDARDMDLSAKVRLENLLKVRDAEKKLSEEEVQLEIDKLDTMEKQANQTLTTAEEEQALTDQRVKVANMEEGHAKKMMSFNRDRMAIERQIAEEAVRRNRFVFQQGERLRSLSLDREVANLELMGKTVQAETLRLNSILENEEARKQERFLQLQQEFRRQFEDQEEADRMAREQSEIESEDRIFKTKQRLAQMEVDMRKQMYQSISNLIGATNEAIFGNSKALAVAQAIMNTYEGVTAALTIKDPFTKWAQVAAVVATGISSVKKIMGTKLGDSSVSDTSSESVSQPNFGLVDTGANDEALATGMAGMFGNQQSPVNIILEGEFDPEFLNLKVRMGADSISGRTSSIGI